MDTAVAKITALAAAHPAARWTDPRNGHMPIGFTKGAALGWGRLAGKFRAKDPAALFCARAAGDPARDALGFYAKQFHALGLDNSADGLTTLRHLWVFVCCLPGPESSWRWWVGVDTTNRGSDTADSAEAGLCQTSWDSRAAKPDLTMALFQHYLTVPEPLLWRDIFSEGIGAPDHPVHEIGSGDGAVFQALSKLAPTFALEYAAIIVRCLRRHYGTIRDRKVVLNPHFDDLFRQVDALIATDPAAFAAALADAPAAAEVAA